MPPRRYDPSVMTYTEIHNDIIDITNYMDNTLSDKRADAWTLWTRAIGRNEQQDVIDAYERKYKSLNREMSMMRNRLFKAKDEKIRRLNHEPTLRQNA